MKILNHYDQNVYTTVHSQQDAVKDITARKAEGLIYKTSLVQKGQSAEYAEINFLPSRT